jgi:DNA invertase Pin-like site-specific DNA recombinase
MKVAIYCRLSEEDKNKQSANDDSESIQNQKSILIEYAFNNGWEIYDIYSDDDYKGSDRNRPAFKKLLEDAEKRKFNIVLCKSQSRFTREMELVEKYIHGYFVLWGIRFIGFADNADTENIGNKKARQINGLVNEWYLEDLSNNIRSVFKNKKSKGVHIGSFALYGYKKDPDKKGHLIIDEESAKIVREIFDLFIQGYGKTPIARILNDKGIPNPTEYKRQQGLRFNLRGGNNGTLWRYSTIASVLRNEMYIGTMVQNKQTNISYKTTKKIQIPPDEWIKVPNTHEPIIDLEVWNQSQEMMRHRARTFADTEKIGIFAKKVKCMYCDYYMRSQKCHEDRYLQCATKYASKSACIGSYISVKTLEKVVLTELRKMFEEYNIGDEVQRNIVYENRMKESIEQINKNINSYRQKQDDATKAVKNLYMDKTKGIITEDEFVEFSREFHQDKERYNQLISDCSQELEKLENKINTFDDKQQIFEEYGNIEKLERVHVDSLIDYVSVGKRELGTKNREITICWKF